LRYRTFRLNLLSGFIEMRLKNPFTYIGTKNRKNSHPKRKFFQKIFQKSFFTRNEKNDTA